MCNKTERALRNCMTAGELIEYLQDQDPEARVVFMCSYGDYHNTMQALPVERCEALDPTCQYLHETAYSGSGLSVERTEGDDEVAAPAAQPAVVILCSAHDMDC